MFTTTVSLLLGACLLAVPDDPVVRIFTASDLPRLAADGVALARDGEYSVHVWGPSGRSWSLEVRGNRLILTTRGDATGASVWQRVGRAALVSRTPTFLEIEGAKFEPKTIVGDYRSETQTTKARPAPSSPVPALVALTTEDAPDLKPLVDVIRGRLDSDSPPDDARRQTVRTNHEGANFQAPATAEAWSTRVRALREQLSVTLGLWPPPAKTPLNPEVFGRVERDGYTIERVTLETLPGYRVSGNLYRPLGVEGKKPLVLCPHGHWPAGRVEPDLQMRCIRWAKLGCVVFLYDMVGYADSKAFGHAFLNDRLRHWGFSLVTLQTWNSIRALDWLTTLPDVDSSRIGCTGESGGGTQTFLLTAIDDRVRVAAPVVMVSDTFQGGCTCENAAGLRWGTDNVEFAALAAPRPQILVGATGDWTARTMDRVLPAIRSVYRLLGAESRVDAVVFGFPHNYNQTSRNAVYAFMARWLLDIRDPEVTREGPQSPEPPDALYTFGDDHPRPLSLKTAAQIEDDLIRERAERLRSLAPGENGWFASRSVLAAIHRIRVGLDPFDPPTVASREVRRSEQNGVTIIHSVVRRPETGESIPVVTLVPPKPTGTATIVASAHGKAVLVAPHGSGTFAGWNPQVKALLDRGQAVVAFDPLLIGEAFDPADPAARRPDTAHFECYNRSLAADRMRDLAAVATWARLQPGWTRIHLLGQGRFGPLALLARPSLLLSGRTAVDLQEGGSRREPPAASVPAEIDLPGLFQFGGLAGASALVAPMPLAILRPGPDFDRSWPENAYRLADAAQACWIADERPGPEALARWLDEGQ